MQYLGAIFKRMASFHFLGKPFNITIIQIYAQTTDASQAEVDWLMKIYNTLWN